MERCISIAKWWSLHLHCFLTYTYIFITTFKGMPIMWTRPLRFAQFDFQFADAMTTAAPDIAIFFGYCCYLPRSTGKCSFPFFFCFEIVFCCSSFEYSTFCSIFRVSIPLVQPQLSVFVPLLVLMHKTNFEWLFWCGLLCTFTWIKRNTLQYVAYFSTLTFIMLEIG